VADLLVVSASGLIPGLLLAAAAVPALLAMNPTITMAMATIPVAKNESCGWK